MTANGRPLASRLAWAPPLLTVCVFVGTMVADSVAGRPSASAAVWGVIMVALTSVGAFIIRRQPRNAIGWLLLFPGLGILDPVAHAVLARAAPAGLAPGRATVPILLAAWYDNVSWMALIFPVILALALFPTGRALSPAWRWHTRLVIGMALGLATLAVLQKRIGPLEQTWSVENPIGVLGPVEAHPWFLPVWNTGLILITVGAVASMVLRYRRAGRVERLQMGWLLYAVTLFALIYIPLALLSDTLNESLIDALLAVALLFIPVAMAVAIARYRLFDIDLVVRRTVTYTIVMMLLAAAYIVSVLLLATLARSLIGVDSPVAVMASTLLVVRLFNPVRRRTQALVDRRLFRLPYDATALLATFGRSARHHTDGAVVTDHLIGTVREALQPNDVTVWLRGRTP